MAKPKKGKDARKATTLAAKPTLAGITQYVVVSLAGLAGFVAYTSGGLYGGGPRSGGGGAPVVHGHRLCFKRLPLALYE